MSQVDAANPVAAHDAGAVPLTRVLLPFAALMVLELAAISLLYNHAFVFTCRDAAPAAFCAALSAGVLRAVAALGVAAVFCLARPQVLGLLRAGMHRRLAAGPLAVQIAGFGMILAPWTFLADGAGAGVLGFAVVLWLGGALAAGLGALLALAPAGVWLGAARSVGPSLALALGVALLSPEIAAAVQGVWDRFDPLSALTFASVEAILTGLGYTVNSDAPTRLLGIGVFNVLVGPQCSGVEGFALISGFTAFYIWLFRDRLRFPTVWLLLPLGILLSWCFNVVRIAVLILIGHHGMPDLAIDGFHSHAGWLMFTLLSVSMAMVAHQVPALRRVGVEAVRVRRAPPPFLADPMVAMILPFIVFMGSALLLSTFTELPSLYYPLRALAMAGVLALFLPYLLGLVWKADPLSIGAGLAVGVAWVVTAPAAAEADTALASALAAMSGPMLAVWVVSRILGTAVLVPVIEELFFRGYVQRRIDSGGAGAQGMMLRLLALAVSSALFAALHDRWLAAGLAGLVFGLLMLRSGRVTDAIIAHAAANALIAGMALSEGDWSLI